MHGSKPDEPKNYSSKQLASHQNSLSDTDKTRIRPLDTARRLLPANVELINEAFDSQRHSGFDLLVFPLSLQGDRAAIYDRPPAQFVCVHDWIWRRNGPGRIVSWLLLKRLNLVQS